MTTRLEYRTNGGYDSVLLVSGETGMVRSDCDCSQDAGDWDDRFGDEHAPEDYGTLVAVRCGYELEAIDAEQWERRLTTILH